MKSRTCSRLVTVAGILFLATLFQGATALVDGVRILHKPDASLPYGGRHVTVADIDTSVYKGGKSSAMKALAACPLDWHMHAPTKKGGGEVLEQWNIPGWGKQYVIKISSDTLDAYADCIVKRVRGVKNVKGPKYSGTPWHVTLYGESQKQAQKSYRAYTAESPRLDWYAYYLVVSGGNPKNGKPGSSYHLYKV